MANAAVPPESPDASKASKTAGFCSGQADKPVT